MAALFDRNPLDEWEWWKEPWAVGVFSLCEDLVAHRVPSAGTARQIVDMVRKANALFPDYPHDDFTAFCELDAATTHLPIGPSCKHWLPAGLELKELELRTIEATFVKRIETAALRILAKRNPAF